MIFLVIISINTTTINSIDDGFTLRLMREDIETSYKETLQTINEEILRGDLSKDDIFAHPRYVSPMLDFILEDSIEHVMLSSMMIPSVE